MTRMFSPIVPWDETPKEKKRRYENLSPKANAYLDHCIALQRVSDAQRKAANEKRKAERKNK